MPSPGTRTSAGSRSQEHQGRLDGHSSRPVPSRSPPVGDEELAEYGAIADEFNIHDGLVVASHRARGTDAIITTDGVVGNPGVESVWD